MKSNGTAVATGVDNYGMVGTVLNWKNITAISTSAEFAIGLQKDGAVVACGGSGYQHGYEYFDVAGWRDIVAISVGQHHAIALPKDG